MTRKKAPPPTFTQRHAESISKLKLVLIVVCLIAIPVSFWLTHEDVGSVNNRVTRIESPCQRYGSDSKLCQEAFETAVHSITHRIACYIDHKSGKPYKRACVGVRLEIETPTRKPSAAKGPTTDTEGGDASEAHTGSSQPGRHEGGSSGEAGHPSNPGKPKVPTEHGEGVPSSPPSSSSSESSSSTSTQTTERVTETVVEAPSAPPVVSTPAPVREAVGGVVEKLGGTVEEAGGTVNETVKGAGCTVTGLLGASC